MSVSNFFLKRRSKFWKLLGAVALLSLLVATAVLAAHVIEGTDVKVTDDNNNVDGGGQ